MPIFLDGSHSEMKDLPAVIDHRPTRVGRATYRRNGSSWQVPPTAKHSTKKRLPVSTCGRDSLDFAESAVQNQPFFSNKTCNLSTTGYFPRPLLWKGLGSRKIQDRTGSKLSCPPAAPVAASTTSFFLCDNHHEPRQRPPLSRRGLGSTDSLLHSGAGSDLAQNSTAPVGAICPPPALSPAVFYRSVLYCSHNYQYCFTK